MAADFFRTIYRSDAHGQAVRGVIESRGSRRRWSISSRSAPRRIGWDGLITTLQRRGVVPAELHAAGLALPRKTSAGYYDGFRNRLMFPIHDQAGRIVALAPTDRPDDEPKYRNSPETAVFNKSSILFGLHQARAAIVASRTAVVTEGYTDVHRMSPGRHRKRRRDAGYRTDEPPCPRSSSHVRHGDPSVRRR
jgi:DNA primase